MLERNAWRTCEMLAPLVITTTTHARPVRRTGIPMSEIKQALDDLRTDAIARIDRLDREQKTTAKLLDDAHAQIEKMSMLAPVERRTSGHGWLDVKNVLTGSDPAGGYLVADEHSTVFIDALRPESVLLRAGARTFQTEHAAVNFPGATSDPAAVWRGEGETLTSGDPVYRRVRAAIKKLQAYVVASNESLADSRPEIARLLESQMAASLALGLDRAVFDPNNQVVNAIAAPTPFANVSGIQTATALGNDGGVPANLDWLTEAIGLLLTANGRLDRAALFLSPRTYSDLLKIEEATGSVKPLLWSERPLDGGPLMRLLGVPTFVSSVLPDDLTKGSSSGNTSTGWLIDMSAVYVVIRNSTRIEVDRSRYFDTDSTALRATLRGDVVLAHPELAIAITGFKTS
jgi:HK97 family phage major capsid protein